MQSSAQVPGDAALPPYGNGTLPAGIRSRLIPGLNGLTVHVLEAGFEPAGRPLVILLHGFPELAYSWRRIMLPLAQAGFHVVAADQRGYGRTTGWDPSYEASTHPFGFVNVVTDTLALAAALGRRQVACVVGHDAGSPAAAWCALIRPDVFRAVVMMSAPFAGPPALPVGAPRPGPAESDDALDAQLAALPRPRKFYQRWYRMREANDDMLHAPQGLHAFLRAYYHAKSADWADNAPHPLASRAAEEFAKLPTYYIMDRRKGMAETVATEMPSADQVRSCAWLTEAELDVYVTEYSRTGFQGGLQGYRRYTDADCIADLSIFAGRTIDVPASFISGRSDWGVYQTPGAVEAMREACTRLTGFHLVEGAGHWVQQEQPAEVARLITAFIRSTA
ncbi:alpha/beta hydrolase [Methylobacterium nonmethylotrophicum]|uniref:Alpha/beta hydrolase n=1 Tax=Methylobacterium nonmethylotrophicum TaxID=1141884 RepID=A0A4Z0NX87_9HYPH|nr:alpha/beta fold hydrolase [Methylobacterium nonmethylotrophicum]TGE01889.1 alpha/beta hydrolase [Methylobacterium nonmethylotrophicum]